jgi:hypothetical protein
VVPSLFFGAAPVLEVRLISPEVIVLAYRAAKGAVPGWRPDPRPFKLPVALSPDLIDTPIRAYRAGRKAAKERDE